MRPWYRILEEWLDELFYEVWQIMRPLLKLSALIIVGLLFFWLTYSAIP